MEGESRGKADVVDKYTILQCTISLSSVLPWGAVKLRFQTAPAGASSPPPDTHHFLPPGGETLEEPSGKFLKSVGRMRGIEMKKGMAGPGLTGVFTLCQEALGFCI